MTRLGTEELVLRAAREECGETQAQVLEALSGVLRSRQFHHEPSLRKLLTHLTRATLEGRLEQLNEYALGVNVLGLGIDFDPRKDESVAHTLRRLREKLDEYYRRDGRDDPVAIDLAFAFGIPSDDRS